MLNFAIISEHSPLGPRFVVWGWIFEHLDYGRLGLSSHLFLSCQGCVEGASPGRRNKSVFITVDSVTSDKQLLYRTTKIPLCLDNAERQASEPGPHSKAITEP